MTDADKERLAKLFEAEADRLMNSGRPGSDLVPTRIESDVWLKAAHIVLRQPTTVAPDREALAKLIMGRSGFAEDELGRFNSSSEETRGNWDRAEAAVIDLVNFIREQPAESSWISVQERLPEVDGKVLVHCPSADPQSPLITTAWYHPEEDAWTLIHPYWIPGIRHWMPLPIPPRGSA